MKKIIIKFSIVFLLAIIVSCEREYNNPWDEKANLAPSAWAPQNLEIEDITPVEKKLTWTYTDQNIEGFKLDRKKGNEAWQEAYQTFPKETRSWNDTEIVPDASLTYSYRVYAFAGSNNSAEQNTSASAAITAPNNLQTEKLTDKSYKLIWTDNSTGEQGFKIDRKIDENNWAIAYGKVAQNIITFTDTNVFRATDVEYRVYAFYGSYESSKITTSTNAELTPPTSISITPNTITSVSLNWQDNSTGEDGFKIERKYEGENWNTLTTVTTNSFEDNNFDLNTQIFYRVCAFVGTYNSSWIETTFDANLPPPENLQITANSATSVTLNWDYNYTGQEGFKIDRKVNQGAWEQEFATVTTGGLFSDNGIDLNNNVYYYRVYAFHSRQYESTKIENHVSLKCGYPFTDSRDGSIYETIQIGNQCWMKENLAYLPSVNDPDNGSQTSAYYYVHGYEGTNVADAKATTNYQTYGSLYNWSAAISACSSSDGWILPSDDDWTILTNYLGGTSVAGGTMKEAGTTHWNNPNAGATNSSGFLALPGGFRGYNGYFNHLGFIGYWWSSTEYSSTNAWSRELYYGNESVYHFQYGKELGISVRCVRDE